MIFTNLIPYSIMISIVNPVNSGGREDFGGYAGLKMSSVPMSIPQLLIRLPVFHESDDFLMHFFQRRTFYRIMPPPGNITILTYHVFLQFPYGGFNRDSPYMEQFGDFPGRHPHFHVRYDDSLCFD